MTASVARRPRHAVALVTAVVALAAGPLAACSSDGERATAVGSATTAPEPPSDRARTTCTAVLDDRSAAVTADAAEASTTVRHALESTAAPTDDQLATIRDALGAERGQLADARDALAAVDVPDEQDWATVVESVDPLIADLDALIEFLRAPDWARDPSTVGLATPTPDRVAVEEALDRLDLLGTDCEWVYVYPGEPRETAPFQHDAAAACATSVERRRADGYDDDTATGDRRAVEWRATVTDLDAVDPSTLEDPTPWKAVVAAARAKADGTDGNDVSDDLTTLGLDQRPCAALGL
ncbi:MAG: hypothetical protein KF906_02535 [Actinobacteria bacterium]|nr:hypothetical protein [Actinomycetota bacterium]